MTDNEKAKRLCELVNGLIPMQNRKVKPRAPKTFTGHDRGGQWYSYVVNDWIPNQPDIGELMELFILLGFDIHAFFYAIYNRLDEWVELKKAGKL